ncbi:hypothetical protein LL912_15800 [Niabella sp. CC-SYL272]|uniref:hypothetical protein n=1 Tax=Niabella agricola TaxID=2891571 RepID=UPI001F3FC52B|nr:hypothetical protein [Niabella agricola]MCF3110248.1 hypothetical protein [Niabella agricola]
MATNKLFPALLIFGLLFFIRQDLSAQKKYAGKRHTTSHGGHYSAGRGSAHKGGHYRNVHTAHHYGRHRR